MIAFLNLQTVGSVKAKMMSAFICHCMPVGTYHNNRHLIISYLKKERIVVALIWEAYNIYGIIGNKILNLMNP